MPRCRWNPVWSIARITSAVRQRKVHLQMFEHFSADVSSGFKRQKNFFTYLLPAAQSATSCSTTPLAYKQYILLGGEGLVYAEWNGTGYSYCCHSVSVWGSRCKSLDLKGISMPATSFCLDNPYFHLSLKELRNWHIASAIQGR